VITPAVLREWPLAGADGDKHSRGAVLAIGGAAATAGALVLTGLAALRSGAGLVQLVSDPQVAATLAVGVPEARVVGWPQDGDHLGELAGDADAVVIGPGLDSVDHASDLLRQVAGRDDGLRLVVDAYALGALSHEPALLHGRTELPVLTPSTTEAAILLHADDPGDLAAASQRIAKRYQAVVALRGHVAHPDGRSWREEAGDTGLGTAGSGDVFAGLLAGLLARGAQPAQAACWGCHVHAMAGQRLAATMGRTGFLARELVEEAPRALSTLVC
jgi:hydroxyethylthiazole kinase-like uncharacterized protein yjeF